MTKKQANDASNYGRCAAQAWQRLIERLESGNIDEDIKESSSKAWHNFVKGLSSVGDLINGYTQSSSPAYSEDPETELEAAYEELQSNLMEVRQAVAHSIATEKQLEQQLIKSREQAATWVHRAAMADQQRNHDLANQCRKRETQYLDASANLERQLSVQKENTGILRERLTELESLMQKSYTQKQVLIARYRAAQAIAKAHEIFSRMDDQGPLSVFARMEKRVAERESSVEFSASAPTLDRPQQDSEQLLIQAIAALEHATTVMERMEKLLVSREEPSSSSTNDDS
jgi:phage shock protein A